MSRPIVVIGGGIVGTAIAYELQKADASTFLVERDVETARCLCILFRIGQRFR